MPSSIIGGRLPNGKYKEVSLDASGRLECSVNEIEITADSITVAVDGLEGLQGTTNTTLSSMSAKLTDIDNSITASTNVVSKLNLIETTNNANEVLLTACSSKLTDIDNSITASTNVVSKLNLIETTNNANEVLLTTCSAKLTDIDTTAGATATILRPYLIEGNVNTLNIKNGVDSLSACCSGSEVQVDIVGGGFDGAITNAHLTELGTAINSAKVDVNIASGNISGFSTATLQGAGLPSALSGSGNLKVSIEEGSSGGDASATNQATMITDLGLIKTSLQLLDDIVQGEDASHGNAHKGVMSLAVRQDTQADFGADGDYSPMSIDANGDLRVKIDDASKTHLSEIESAVETIEACVGSNKVNVNISSGNISGFATESTLGDAEAHLGTIDTNIANAETHLGNIDAGVDVLEACVGSNKVNVNISSGNISGFATESTLGDAEAHLGTIDTNIANAEAHLGEIEGAVETIEACCGSNKVNVNISSGNISGFATSTLQGTINTSLGTLETSLTSMESKQDTQITHLSEIEGAVETLEGSLERTSTQLLYGSGNLVANGTPESSSNSVEMNNNSQYVSIFIEGQNTNWDAFAEWSYNNSVWFGEQGLNIGSQNILDHNLKKGKYLRVKINNTHGTNGDTNSFVVNVVQ